VGLLSGSIKLLGGLCNWVPDVGFNLFEKRDLYLLSIVKRVVSEVRKERPTRLALKLYASAAPYEMPPGLACHSPAEMCQVVRKPPGYSRSAV
jgi:hypothetical protein